MAQTAPVPADNTWYGVVARGSGRALEVRGAAAEAGAAVVQWEFTQAPSQQWRFVRISPGSEWYRIEVRHSTKCLTAERADENAPVVQRPYTGSLFQQWKLVAAGPIGSAQLVCRGNETASLAVASADKANGTAVVLQRYLGRAAQQWRLFPLRLRVAPSAPTFGQLAPLAAAINTPANELQPVLTADGKTLYFVRTRFAGNMEGVAESGDIWTSQTTDDGQTWSPATRLDALNTPQHNGVQAVLAGGEALLLRGWYQPRENSSRDEGASRARRVGSGWGKIESLEITNYYSTGTSTTFFQPADEKVLLMSLERADGQGGNDLYVSQRDGNGGWGEPHSLGPVVNSPGFDFAPWLAPDGKTLYFASYGHAGYGSADIFVTERQDETWTRWSEPLNLGPAVNSAGFDAYFSLGPDGKSAYWAMSRTANGPADIVRAAAGLTPPTDTAAAKPVVAVATTSVPPRGFVTGKVLDARTRKPVVAQVKAQRLGGDMVFNATGQTDAAGGNFQFSLPAGRYRLAATAGGFLTAADTVIVNGAMNLELLVLPAAVGAKLELPTIIFAQGKASLLSGSYNELNRLARTLLDNPSVQIRLEGHTDNQGDAQKNKVLSEQRVAEVKRYLVSRGVGEERISTVGYGGSRPRASNEREETRRLNRRVEFTITKQ
ncbi:hypothetical protein B0919_12120 [Hymenobacter sp. CRA2]|nr:hypothetical protein B0919_12120 [Hymenobacter sp. CRA2]